MIGRLFVGSKLFIQNYHDEDELIIVENERTDEEIEQIKLQYKTNHDVFVHRVSELDYFQGADNYYLAQMKKEHRLNMIEGTFPLEPDDKILCSKALKNHAFSNVHHINGGVSKTVMYVLLILYYFRNGNTLLSEDERQELQMAHDGYFPLDKLNDLKSELTEILNRL